MWLLIDIETGEYLTFSKSQNLPELKIKQPYKELEAYPNCRLEFYLFFRVVTYYVN